jgi:hypothetical protein
MPPVTPTGPWCDDDGRRWCCGLICGRPCPYGLLVMPGHGAGYRQAVPDSRGGVTGAGPAVHEYLSTSCLHADADGRPELHAYCRSRTGSNGETQWHKEPASCKFCGAPCTCECHVTPVSRDELAHLARDWDAQAAGIERDHLSGMWIGQDARTLRRS